MVTNSTAVKHCCLILSTFYNGHLSIHDQCNFSSRMKMLQWSLNVHISTTNTMGNATTFMNKFYLMRSYSARIEPSSESRHLNSKWIFMTSNFKSLTISLMRCFTNQSVVIKSEALNLGNEDFFSISKAFNQLMRCSRWICPDGNIELDYPLCLIRTDTYCRICNALYNLFS